jgi:ABC-type microcin C transport system permease subunit YejB
LGKIVDYFWHLALPLIALSLAAFATTTLLTKNSFIDEIRKQYVTTARAKGLTERQVLYRHVFRNAMLIVIAGFPGAFISAFFSGSLLIETIFSLDGLGRLGFESIIKRDYPVVFATLFIFSLMGLVVGLISDLVYTWVDPRIDFEKGMSDERAGFQPTHRPMTPTGRPKGWLSPTNRRRWANFKANRRGYWSLWIFMILFHRQPAGRVHCQ